MLHRSMIRVALIVLATCIALAVALPAGAETPLGIRVDGLRYQAEAYAYGWHPQQVSRGETTAGIRADGLRYQAEAYAYGWHPQQTRGETAAGIRAEGLRYQEEARVYLLRARSGGGYSILVYGLIVSGVVLAAAGALLLLRAKSKMTGPSFATSMGGS